MIEIEGYIILENIFSGSRSLVYRAEEEESARTVVIKIYNNEYPTAQEAAGFQLEYDLTRKPVHVGVIQVYELRRFGNSPAIIMEDFGGRSLLEILEERPLESLTEFLNLAHRISQALGAIHEKNIIHKDINPANIVWNPEKELLKIIDFGIATELPREITSIKNLNVLEGTLAYISPEQTGRMNRSLDYRTDIYSLGLTFYRMLSGRLPFESKDPLELVHSHIALQATPLHELNSEIPETVSRIIEKMTAKNAEDRYQGTFGLGVDLERCLEELKEGGVISLFEPGLEDVSDILQIPQKLYGREESRRMLMSAFERVSQGARELMLVAGFSGIGKSVLINEIQKPIVKHRGYFISGKFEKLKKDVPYSAIIQAFAGLIKQCLSEGEEQISFWKNRLLNVLGPNGKIISELIPEVELLIGKQDTIPELGPVESKNRFNLVLQGFIRAFAGKKHPLVLFLDDLQWADSGSLDLLKLFIGDPDLQCMFIIGAYRHNETPDSHPFMLTLEEIKKSGAKVNSILLQSLSKEHIKELLADALKRDSEATDDLAGLLLEKTGGNPFFVSEFLKSLYSEKMLEYSHGMGWSWNLEKIKALQVTDNVVHLMAEKISRLPRNLQEIIKYGACIGNGFTLETLTEIYKEPEADILVALHALVREGLLFVADNTYVFIHDRVQEAAYSLIPEQEKGRQHYRIGKLELERISELELNERIFYLVNHLNAGIDFIPTRLEKTRLAELNLRAGRKALASNAYTSALKFLLTGTGLLSHDGWLKNYELTLHLYQGAVSAAQLSADYQRMEKLAKVVFKNAKNIQDEIVAHEAVMFADMAQNQPLQGIQKGLALLRRLGVRLPEKPSMLRTLHEFQLLKFSLMGKTVESLVELPDMKDPKMLMAMRIFSSLATPAYISAPSLLPLLVLKAVRLSIKYGNCTDSHYFYAGFGMISCGVLGEISNGYEYGKLCLSLLEKYNIRDSRAKVLSLVWYFIMPWKKPIGDSIEPLLKSFSSGLECGDLEFASFSALSYLIAKFYAGENIADLENKTTKFVGVVEKLQQHTYQNYILVFQQFILNLRISSDKPGELMGTAYDETVFLPLHIQANDHSALFALYFYKLMLNCFFENYASAIENSEKAFEYIDGARSTPGVPSHFFYDSLSRLALYRSSNKSEQKKHLKQIRKNQKKVKKWAAHAPENHRHKYLLIVAELHRIQGKETLARKYYEQAINLAQRNKVLHEEALARFIYGKFWLGLQQEKFAGLYVTEARDTFRMYGADALVEHIESKYGHLLSLQGRGDGADSVKASAETSGTGSTRALDLDTVMKASRTISGEIILSSLLEKMMKIVMENAGAQKGFLILNVNGELYIEANGSAAQGKVEVLDSTPLKGNQELPENMIHYVSRTMETIVLKNASKEGDYISDPFVLKHRPASILCAPILNHGEVSGVLYLENNSAIGAFTRDRVKVLEMLSSQIAISIENAGLYANLEEKVKERTTQLETANEKLRELDQLKNNLFANISHEIRTPLTLILSPLEQILGDRSLKLENRPLELLRTMAANGQKLLQQVNDLLDLAKFDAGKMSLNFRRVEMVRYVSELAGYFMPVAVQKNIEIKVLGRSPLWVHIDPEKFEKVILNLFSNALKFTGEGEILVELAEHGDVFLMTFQDTGKGISPGEEKSIFERFHRAESNSKRKYEGTGIGLALTKEIILLHQGNIHAESGRSVGARIMVEMPIRSDVAGLSEYSSTVVQPEIDSAIISTIADDARPQVVRANTMEESDFGDLQTDRPNLLLVEDNAAMAEYLVSILEEDFAVRWVENGALGLEAALRHGPELIISDVMMPEMDGLTMLSHIRENERMAMTPIIMLSAKSELEERLKGLSAGADDYLGKPFRPEELILKVRNLLHKGALFELGKHKERESVYTDLHDYLGGSLTDMAMMVERLKAALDLEHPLIVQLEQNVEQAVRNYKHCFTKIKDLEDLSEEFLFGLNLILLRRYENFDRELIFKGDEVLNRIFSNHVNDSLKTILYGVITEIATNDLKYGKDVSNWNLSYEQTRKVFQLDFSATTVYSNRSAGRGTGNILGRVEKIGGKVGVEVKAGMYTLKLTAPVEY